MKRAWLMCLSFSILAASSLAVSARENAQQDTPPKSITQVGEIMDSKCATVGTHDSMIKKIGTKDARDCTLTCAKNGSFVLYDPETKTVYQLDDQQKPMRFAGSRVKISGPYDANSKTIQIQTIDAVN